MTGGGSGWKTIAGGSAVSKPKRLLAPAPACMLAMLLLEQQARSVSVYMCLYIVYDIYIYIL
jgi:hypothetical protein